jgi:hypothetical protein
MYRHWNVIIILLHVGILFSKMEQKISWQTIGKQASFILTAFLNRMDI